MTARTYTLLGPNRQPYQSATSGALGGHRPGRVYGRLDCPAALRSIARGGYIRNRVFFADVETAVAAGYRPCAVCLPDEHAQWKAGGKRSPPLQPPRQRPDQVASDRRMAEDRHRASPAHDGRSMTPRAWPSRLSGCALSASLVLVGVVLGSAGTNAQPSGRPYRIGVLNNAFAPGSPPVMGLRAGIKAEGLEEGRDVRFDVRSTGSDGTRTTLLAAALARENPDVIVAFGENETRTAKAAAPQIPIVFTQIADPIAIGLVSSVARPGGHVTGVSNLFAELVPKRLELAKELMPNLRRVLVVYDAQDPASAAGARKAQETAPRLKLNVVVRAVRTQEEAVRELKTASAGDVLLAPATLNLNLMELILNLNLYMVAPAIFPASFWVQAGGVASYGPDYYAEGVQAARLVAKVLRGARPADLPVESVNKLELALNRKTLKAFGVTIPTSLAVRVDQVFEGIGE